MKRRKGMRRLGLVVGILGAGAGTYLSYTTFVELLDQLRLHSTYSREISSLSPKNLAVLKTGNCPGGVHEDAKRMRIIQRLAPQWQTRGKNCIINAEGVHIGMVGAGGDITEVELQSGEIIGKTDPPPIRSYLILLIWPLVEFVVPWGIIRTPTCVGRGLCRSQAGQLVIITTIINLLH